MERQVALKPPSGAYGKFSEKGYQFDCWIPDSDEEERAFRLRVSLDTRPLLELLIPMGYAPIFGVDVDDVQTLEAITEKLIQALPEGEPPADLVDKIRAVLQGECTVNPVNPT